MKDCVFIFFAGVSEQSEYDILVSFPARRMGCCEPYTDGSLPSAPATSAHDAKAGASPQKYFL